MSEYEEQNPGWRNIGDLTEEEREFALERFIEEESLSEQALDASIRDSRLSVYLPFEELIKLDRNDPVAVQKAYVRALQIEMEQEAAKVLGVPDSVTQTALLPVAYYKGAEFKPAGRLPARQRTHWNTWGKRRPT